MLGVRGAAVFVQRHADLLKDVEYIVNEGAWNRVENGRLLFYSVALAEKLNFSQRLTVRGTPGHGSRPNAENAVVKLVRALDAISRLEQPLTVTPVVARYFREIAPMYAGEERRWLEDIGAAIADARAREWLLSDPSWHAYLRNTAQITVLQASVKTNLIPAEASAELDIRLLPGADTAAFMSMLTQAVGNSRASWTRVFPLKSDLASPMETDFFKAIARVARARDPGAIVTPLLVPGGTDMPWYRPTGAIAYGVDPFRLERVEQQRGLHGNDERVPVASVGAGVRFIYDLLLALQ
jgi:acetylornithine deacetylase/succinyl-diaminopimelate desuccinylase-like protein